MALVVCTGTNGFIGNNLLDFLLKADAKELGLQDSFCLEFMGTDTPDSLSRPQAARFMGSQRYQYVDYQNLFDKLNTLKTPPIAIIHNGACSSTLATDPEIFKTLNVEYSQKLWNYCCKNRVPFIYASSASIYGDGAKGFSDALDKVHEFTPLHLYGKSKIDFDKWVLEQKETPPFWFGLRYFNVYGPFETHKENQISMVLRGFQQIISDGCVKLFKGNSPQYGDGEQVRDFVYVKDVCQSIWDLVSLGLKNQIPSSLEKRGCYLNVGTGKPRSWNDLIKALFSALNKTPAIRYIDMPSTLAKQYQDYTCADLSSWNRLGLHPPRTSVEEGVNQYVVKYLMRGL